MSVKRSPLIGLSPANRRRQILPGGQSNAVGVASRLQQLANNKEKQDTSQNWVRDKLVSDQDSVWFGSEVLYIIRTKKKQSASQAQASAPANKQQKKGNSSSSSSSAVTSNSAAGGVSHQSDRYLAILRRKDAVASTLIVHVVIKGNEVEVKNSWELRLLRGVDVGADDFEMVLSFDTADYAMHFVNKTERDETVWIMVQCCRHFCTVEVSVGYAIDLESMVYSIVTNGTLDKFPLLEKLKANIRLGDGSFGEDEAEAENLLEELQWTSHAGAPAELQLTLSKQSEALNMEIIDFLLQWEEESWANNNNNNNNTPASGTSATTKNSKNNTSAAPYTSDSLVSADVQRLRDTAEVLDALSLVDSELQGVDDWIGEQLDRLGEIQSKLRAIEVESSTLEASFQNLNSVKDIIETLASTLEFDKDEEYVLRNPHKVIDTLLKQPDLSDLEDSLNPLCEALARLQTALSLKGGHGLPFTQAQWKQLQTMNAISAQRQKLNEFSDDFCKYLSQYAPTIFDSVLKHKSLNNEKGGGHAPNIGVKVPISFTFTNVISQGIVYNSHSSKLKSREHGIYFTSQAPAPLTLHPSSKIRESNQAFAAQRVLHGVLSDFMPLFEGLLVLRPDLALSVSSAYVNSMQDKFYKPLLKSIFKDLHDSLIQHHSIVNMATLPAYKLGNDDWSVNTQIRFQVSGGKIAPWAALGVALLLIAPLIKREEAFFAAMFTTETTGLNKVPESTTTSSSTTATGIQGSGSNTHSHNTHNTHNNNSNTNNSSGSSGSGIGNIEVTSVAKSPAETMIGLLFDVLPSRIEKLMSTSSTQSDTDGFEALGMLAVVEKYLQDVGEHSQEEVSTHLNADASTNNNDNDNDNDDDNDNANANSHRTNNTVQKSSSLDSNDSVTDDRDIRRRALLIEDSSPFFIGVLNDVRTGLLKRIQLFVNDQIAWIKNQKGDPKKAGVQLPVSKFPSFISQVLEMTGGMVRYYILFTICIYIYIHMYILNELCEFM